VDKFALAGSPSKWIAYQHLDREIKPSVRAVKRRESRYAAFQSTQHSAAAQLVFNLNACVYSVSLVLSFAKLFVRLFLPVCGP